MGDYLRDLGRIAPETVLVAVACAALIYDIVTKGRDSRRVGYLTLGGLALTTLLLFGQWRDVAAAGPMQAFDMVTLDLFGTFFKLFTSLSMIVVTLFVLSDRRERRHGVGEYYFLLLGAAIGAFFMVSTTNLLLLMLGLELLSLASYSLAGFHKGDRRSAEAAIKYVVFGGLSAGLMLYGISLLYGVTGSIDLAEIAASPRLEELMTGQGTVGAAIAIVMILGGFAYKISVVPFHFWTPDVYEGAPTPVTTFLAVGSKAAGFAVLLRFFGVLFAGEALPASVLAYGGEIGTLLAIIAAVTMTLGNLSALRQASFKRMLAYSSIAHAGYALAGLAVMNETGFSSAVFYMAAYYFMNLGAFGVLLYFEGQLGTDRVEDLRGLAWKAPLIAVPLVVFLISLTGLPPTIGFLGKYFIFLALWNSEASFAGWLLIAIALNTVISLFYYFRPVKLMFLSDESERSVRPHGLLTTVLVALAVLTLWFGLAPGGLAHFTEACTQSLELVSSH